MLRRFCIVAGILAATVGALVAIRPAIYASIAPDYTPHRWEHGWETAQVKATRYKNPNIGYNIGFQFVRIPYDCDRPELFEFFDHLDAWPYEGGGSPGAPIYVKFKDVTDIVSADIKLQAILPALSKIADDIEHHRL